MKKQENSVKVLIAGNSETWVRQLTYAIKDAEGKTLGSFLTGRGVVDQIQTSKPDIVVLSMVLPGADAIQIMYATSKCTHNPAFFIMTPTGREDIVSMLYAAGASQVFVQPYDIKNLVDRIMNWSDIVTAATQQQSSPEPVKSMDISSLVARELHNLGFPRHLLGRQALMIAIEWVVDDPDRINAVTKELYPDIAKYINNKYQIDPSDTERYRTWTRIERSIRSAIERVWRFGNHAYIEEVFGYSINLDKGKPTNSEFIAMIADKIRIEIRNDK